jgi:cell wall-associated NlpC family hydrolase
LRVPALKRIRSIGFAIAALALTALMAAPSAMATSISGGVGYTPPPPPQYGSGGNVPPPAAVPAPTTPLPQAVVSKDGRTAIPPASAPLAVKKAIWAANRITSKPYRYGGGHRRWRDTGYDCSGSVSYALHGGGIIDSPLFSGLFMKWGEAGRGQWITVYTNPGHAYAILAGLRFDTSGPGERGPRWRLGARSSRGFMARHPEGL